MLTLCFFSCNKDENSTPLLLTQEDIKSAQHFNAFFDFFAIIESMNFNELANNGYLTDLGSDAEYAIRYAIDFPENHLDARGNKMEGKLQFVSTSLNMIEPGNKRGFIFDGFEYNDILVEGAKFMDQISEGKIDWCQHVDCEEAESAPYLQLIFPDESVSKIRGKLSKKLSPGAMEVTGTSYLVINEKSYTVEIEEAMYKDFSCDWYTGGKLNLMSNKQTIMMFGQDCDGTQVKVYDETMTEEQTFDKLHELWN